jgi:YD repeat-containing protein
VPVQPVLSSVVPSTLVADGTAQAITVGGVNFVPGAQILFGANALITEYLGPTQLRATVPGSLLTGEGSVHVAVSTSGGVSNALAVTLESAAPVIEGIEPALGDVGTLVTITGRGFDATPGDNEVSFAGNAVAAVLSATRTQLTVRVPPTALSGPVQVRTARGSVLGPAFTVTRDQDFALVVSPAEVRLLQGAKANAALELSSLGTQPFTGLAALGISGLPAGVVAEFKPSNLSAAQSGALVLSANSAATPGTYSVTVTGSGPVSGLTQSRTASFTLVVAAAQGVTGVQGRFVTPDGRGIAGVIVRADTGQAVQPQTTTDSAGTFLLTGLPPGTMTLRFDATPAHPLYPIWPYSYTVEAGKVLVLPDWTINPPPAAENFTPIQNAAQTQVVTDERFPGLEIRLPAGVQIVGWDGVAKTRISVEQVDIAKLPVTPPPAPVGSAYQLFFGTPMGGIPSAPIPVTLPNDVQAEPGEAVNIWFFDGSPMAGSGEWKIAGQGIVTEDGTRIRMPDGTGIPRFCGVCGLMCAEKTQPAPDIPPTDPEDRDCAGNPVDLSNGQEMPSTGGLRCGGLTPISTGMTYNPVDAFGNIAGTAGSVGLGWMLDYDIAFLPFSGPQKRLVMPSNNRVNFVDDGTGAYRPVNDPRFDGATIRATDLAANEWELQFRDRRIWRFRPFPGIPDFIRGGPPTFVTEIVDAQGNTLTINRQPNGRIMSIGSAVRAIAMTYGANGFVSEMRDSAGRVMRYAYNADNRLSSVTTIPVVPPQPRTSTDPAAACSSR